MFTAARAWTYIACASSLIGAGCLSTPDPKDPKEIYRCRSQDDCVAGYGCFFNDALGDSVCRPLGWTGGSAGPCWGEWDCFSGFECVPHQDGNSYCWPAVASIEITPPELTLASGEQKQLTAVAYDGAHQAFDIYWFGVWESDNAAVASVNSDGLVTAGTPGIAWVAACAPNGACVGINVYVIAAPEVVSVSVTPTTATHFPGETGQFSATAYDNGGNVVDGVNFSWSSYDTSVVTIDPVTGLAIAGSTTGWATIRACTNTNICGNASFQTVVPSSYVLHCTNTAASVCASIPHHSSLDATSFMTVEAWVRFDNDASSYTYILDKYDEYSMAGWYLTREASGQAMFAMFINGTQIARVYSANALVANHWYHIAGVWDQSWIHLYVDGLRQASDSWDLPALTNVPLKIVRASITSSQGVLIDEVRISANAVRYTDTFTPAARFENDANTSLLLHFDGATLPVQVDSSSHANNPTTWSADATLVPETR